MQVDGSVYEAHRGVSGTSMTGGLSGGNVSYVDSTYIMKTLWQGSISARNLIIRQTTSIKPGDLYVKVNTVIKNEGTTTQYNVYYTRTVDPDNEAEMPGGSYTTDNKIISQPPHPDNHVLVTATGTTYGSLLALGTKDPRAKAYLVDFGLVPTSNLADLYAGSGSAASYYYDTISTRSLDAAIGIVYKLDSIPAGDSVSVNYAYIFETVSIPTAFADFTDPTALPLQFLSFHTRADNCRLLVDWTYGSDEGVENFLIEKSTDDKRFHTIAVLSNKAGTYVDLQPTPGNSYYRIKAKTHSQKYYYSGTSLVKGNDCPTTQFSIKPNPAKDFMEIIAPVKFESGTYTITNSEGRVVLNGVLLPNTKNTVDIHSLHSGEYVVSLLINNTVYSSRVSIK